ncbi:MAG: GSCFA domain-containing protein [Bacteroidales bacterium]|nr:GSCFA domain-containing protein [Bacteroidales bacterium]
MKLQTLVEIPKSKIAVSYRDKVMVLGSCFADNVGQKMVESGLDVMVNPFGTLYNPVSISNSIKRLADGHLFAEDDCIQMGAGANLICSYSHHTSLARDSKEEFLQCANDSLKEASSFWKDCNVVIITLGTSFCFKSVDTGNVVSNCLKRPAKEFERFRLELDEVKSILSDIVESNPEKKFIFTVSPVRHLSDGALGNRLSKSILLLSESAVVESHSSRCDYFPSYEIMMDELRDYRFYAEDMVHPSAQAVQYIWEGFLDFCLDESDREELNRKVKAYRQSQHRQLH